MYPKVEVLGPSFVHTVDEVRSHYKNTYFALPVLSLLAHILH